MRIPEDIIEKVLDYSRIEEVISDHITLKKAGANLIGKCPFHDEKTGSFTVSPSKNIFKCFGCGVGGNSVTFLMKHKNVSYPEAIKMLADKYKIYIEEKEATPEQIKTSKLKLSLYSFYDRAAEYFHNQLFLPENALALEYIASRFSMETIKLWKLGYATKSFTSFYETVKLLGLEDDFLLSSGLVSRSSKNQKIYDFFQDRIIFPISDKHNRIISFSGRILPESNQKAKYMNLKDTPLYHKSDVLFGFNFASDTIYKKNLAVLVEGNPDVVKLQEIGIENAVGSCGTALAQGQIDLLQKTADNVILLYDADPAGQAALEKSGLACIENNLVPYAVVLPPGEDPDSFFKSKIHFNEYVRDSKNDYINYYAFNLFNKINNDPSLKNDAINKICELLFFLSPTKQSLYIEMFSKQSKIKGKLFQDRLKELQNNDAPLEKVRSEIPDSVNANEYEKYGFYIYKNSYTFRSKGDPEKLSNFIMKPIFHVESTSDSKRIYELINENGRKVVIDLDMNEMTSLQAFQRNIEGKGNFMFWGTMTHFQKLKLKLYQDTRTCTEIMNLGWQKEGFWAWANGITHTDKTFTEIDEYGVVTFNEQNFFIPAFSKIYLSDKSVFLDERKFMYKPNNLPMNDWMKLYLKVHGNNSMIAFAWYIAALFRDYILYLNDNFPLLNLFGQKGSGKNTLAYSLLSLFGKKQTEYNIHNGTKPGLAKHLEMFVNSIAFIDEYKNSLDFDKIETLKSIYNSIGRSRLNMDKGGKKETTQVNQAVIVAGQEMPTIDIALSSRMIFLQFLTKEGLTHEQKTDFENLQAIERNGLPHFSTAFLLERDFFIENFKDNYDVVMKDITEATKQHDINDRLLRNMATVMAAFKTLEPKFNFAFDYKTLFSFGVQSVIEHNAQLKQSDEIGVFWNLIEALFDDNLLIDKWHFRMRMTTKLSLTSGKVQFPDGKRILKIKFNSLGKLYMEQLRKRGEKPLPLDSLQHYLMTNRNFIGVEKSCKFTRKDWNAAEGHAQETQQNTSAFCFDYDLLGVNLVRENINKKPNPYDSNDPANKLPVKPTPFVGKQLEIEDENVVSY